MAVYAGSDMNNNAKHSTSPSRMRGRVIVVRPSVGRPVSQCIDRFSPELWLLWISNVEIWTSTMGPRHKKTLGTFCLNESIFRAAS